jgi:hypothetical protein
VEVVTRLAVSRNCSLDLKKECIISSEYIYSDRNINVYKIGVMEGLCVGTVAGDERNSVVSFRVSGTASLNAQEQNYFR